MEISRKLFCVAGVQFVLAVVMVSMNLPEINFWNISEVSQRSGYIYSFLGYAHAVNQSRRPQGYDVAVVDEILGELDGSEGIRQGDSPNVIVIMDEAFADLPAIYGFETDVDALPVIHSMQENTVKGNLLVSVYGGTTSNTEYEFLTGNSMAFIPGGSNPYVEYISSEQQSLAWKMRERGYCAISYHPYYENGYRRNIVYPLLGFEEFYFITDEMPYNEYLREYLSDSSDFKNVIAMYESRDPDQPFFIFNVTMQNHGGYGATESAVDVTVTPLDESLQKPQMEEYLSLIYETDRAFGELVDYFSQVEEDTIILMFGDHQPGLGFDVAECTNGGENSLLEFVQPQQQKFVSSFVMWANFDIGSEEIDLVSPNYLQALLLERAGVSLSVYDQYLLKVYEQFPAINALGYYDKEGNWYDNKELNDELLQNYAFMVYNNVFDKKKMTAKYYQ